MNMGCIRWFCCVGVSILLLTTSGHANGIIGDEVIKPPLFDTFQPPSNVGETYTDPAFGTVIKRLTKGYGSIWSNTEVPIFNADDTKFVIQINGDAHLFHGVSGEFIRVLKLSEVGVDLRPVNSRWHQSNPDLIYSIVGNELRLYNINDLSFTLIYKFSEYSEISTPYGGNNGSGDGNELSEDGRYWVLSGNNHSEAFVFDLHDKVKGPTKDFSGTGLDYITMAPSGDYVIVFIGNDYADKGTYVYDRSWNLIKKILPFENHNDIGRDNLGRDLIIMTDTAVNDPVYNDWRQQWGVTSGDVVGVTVPEGDVTVLAYIPKWSNSNFTSAYPSHGKYVYITNQYRNYDPDDQWYPYWLEIIEVPTDGSGQVRRFCHHRSRKDPQGIFNDGTYIWVNRSGTRLLFTSNFAMSDSRDLYMFTIEPRDEPLPPTDLRISAPKKAGP